MGENMAELTGHRGGARRRVPVRTLAEALKNNIVLLVALLAAAVTCFFVPPEDDGSPGTDGK